MKQRARAAAAAALVIGAAVASACAPPPTPIPLRASWGPGTYLPNVDIPSWRTVFGTDDTPNAAYMSEPDGVIDRIVLHVNVNGQPAETTLTSDRVIVILGSADVLGYEITSVEVQAGALVRFKPRNLPIGTVVNGTYTLDEWSSTFHGRPVVVGPAPDATAFYIKQRDWHRVVAQQLGDGYERNDGQGSSIPLSVNLRGPEVAVTVYGVLTAQ